MGPTLIWLLVGGKTSGPSLGTWSIPPVIEDEDFYRSKILHSNWPGLLVNYSQQVCYQMNRASWLLLFKPELEFFIFQVCHFLGQIVEKTTSVLRFGREIYKLVSVAKPICYRLMILIQNEHRFIESFFVPCQIIHIVSLIVLSLCWIMLTTLNIKK